LFLRRGQGSLGIMKRANARVVANIFKASLEETNAMRAQARKEGKAFGAWARERCLAGVGDGGVREVAGADETIPERVVGNRSCANDVPGINGFPNVKARNVVKDSRCARCKRVGLRHCPACIVEVERAKARAAKFTNGLQDDSREPSWTSGTGDDEGPAPVQEGEACGVHDPVDGAGAGLPETTDGVEKIEASGQSQEEAVAF
jgi:hypothetical protein